MKYPIAIEPGDDTQAFGVIVPDLPGCFSAGDTLDEAFDNAKEAISGWLECEIDEGHDIPAPSSLEVVSKNPEFKGWTFGVVDVDVSKLSEKVERVNICLPSRILRRLDNKAKKSGESRSGYIARMIMSQSA